jgi:hypothetical protein
VQHTPLEGQPVVITNGHYLAYLLRIWQIKDAEQLIWRASLEDPHTGERQGFATFEALIHFLLERIHNETLEKEVGQDYY